MEEIGTRAWGPLWATAQVFAAVLFLCVVIAHKTSRIDHGPRLSLNMMRKTATLKCDIVLRCFAMPPWSICRQIACQEGNYLAAGPHYLLLCMWGPFWDGGGCQGRRRRMDHDEPLASSADLVGCFVWLGLPPTNNRPWSAAFGPVFSSTRKRSLCIPLTSPRRAGAFRWLC